MIRFARVLPALLLLGAASPAVAGAQEMSPVMIVQSTPTYTVVLQIGPAEQMMPAGSASNGMSGEVVVGQVGMEGTDTGMATHDSSMSSNGAMSTMSDQGMAANHHLEVHITDNATGALANDVSPVIRVRDTSTGVSRDLNNVMAMYGAGMGMSDLHYGQNVWLPDGQYDVTVMLGAQSAAFKDVQVTDGNMPLMMMGG